MGKDINIKVLARDRQSNQWKEIKLYHKRDDKIEVLDFYPFRNYDIFEILQKHKGDPEFKIFPISLAGLPSALQKEIIKAKEDVCFDFLETTLADLKFYLMKHPKVKNYDYDEDEDDQTVQKWEDNPIKFFIERLEYYLEFALESYWEFNYSYADIKIIYWFDC